MIYIFVSTLSLLVLLSIVYFKKINYKELKYDSELSKDIETLGENVEIATDILKMHGNNHTKVENNKEKNAKISYYDHSKDKIVVGGFEKSEYTRIINIAHECVHTTQNKKYLVMNKVFSNLQILYFLFVCIYFFYIDSKELKLMLLVIQIFIWFITTFVKMVIESDACYRSVQFAKDYLTQKIGQDTAAKFTDKVEIKVYESIPMYFINFLVQGGIMAIIAQIIALIS
ncbi:MAG: zinc metallopeptidase [Clostridia bacterium]|nr:zinc metallopeptidase [Clostridia bacterium]